VTHANHSGKPKVADLKWLSLVYKNIPWRDISSTDGASIELGQAEEELAGEGQNFSVIHWVPAYFTYRNRITAFWTTIPIISHRRVSTVEQFRIAMNDNFHFCIADDFPITIIRICAIDHRQITVTGRE
jgi:hypothetical protein